MTGRVTNQGPGALALGSVGLAGQGTLAAATTVQLSQLLPGGGLQALAQGSINAGGSFSLQAPLNVGVTIAQALNAAGTVIGSVVVGATGSVAGNVVVAAPITTQTSLQSQVLTAAAGCGASTAGGGGGEPAGPDASVAASPAASPSVLPGSLLSLDVAALIDAELTGAIAAAVPRPRSNAGASW